MAPTTIAAALTDLLFVPGLPLGAAVDRHFSPDYRQRTDGIWADRDEFTAHIAHLRTLVSGGAIHVHEELRHGTGYAERHTVDVLKVDGSAVSTEVYVFGEHSADGRFRRIEEVTLMLSGTEADRGLGSAR